MNDTEILDWLHVHLVSFKCAATDFAGKDVYELVYLDREGIAHAVRGLDLRDCVRGAVADLKTVYSLSAC